MKSIAAGKVRYWQNLGQHGPANAYHCFLVQLLQTDLGTMIATMAGNQRMQVSKATLHVEGHENDDIILGAGNIQTGELHAIIATSEGTWTQANPNSSDLQLIKDIVGNQTNGDFEFREVGRAAIKLLPTGQDAGPSPKGIAVCKLTADVTKEMNKIQSLYKKPGSTTLTSALMLIGIASPTPAMWYFQAWMEVEGTIVQQQPRLL